MLLKKILILFFFIFLNLKSEMKKSGEEREQEKQDSQILKKLMKKKSKKSQKVKKSWLRTSTNLKTKEPKKTKLVRLYNVVDDPFERNEISDEHPQVVNVMLTKLADYYDVSVPPRYPAYDLRADPALGDGVWRPWRLTPAQMRNMTAEDKKKYSQETHVRRLKF